MRTASILKKIISERQVTQTEIAKAVGIGNGSLSDVLSGKFVGKETTIRGIIDFSKLSKEQELEVWKAWTLDRGETKAAEYFEKLDKENKKLKKILASIKELYKEV